MFQKDKKVANTKGSLITPALASALDRDNISDRMTTIVLSAAVKTLGDTIENDVLNKESVRKTRKKSREQVAKSLKQFYKSSDPLVIHWDGKLLPALTSKEKVYRIWCWCPLLIQ